MRRGFATVAFVLAFGGAATAADGVGVCGRIVDARGSALRGIVVLIHDDSGFSEQLSTDSHGRYSAIGLSSGDVRIDVIAGGYEPIAVDCRIPSGGFARFDAALSHGSTNSARREFACRLEPRTSDTYIIE